MLLKDQKEFYKVCFDSMQMGILVYNKNKSIVLSNNTLTAIFNYSSTELHGENIGMLFQTDSLFKEFMQHPNLDKFKHSLELVGLKKNGLEIPVGVTFGKMEYNNQVYYKAIVSDISFRKEKETEISNLTFQLEKEVKFSNQELVKAVNQLKKSLDKEKELNHLKTKFIALASHEFKTPLSAILTSTELIVKYADLKEHNKRDEHVAKVKIMINHLDGMLDDFLTLENIELGNIKPTFAVFKFHQLIKETIQNTTPFLKKKQTLYFENNVDDIVCQDPKIIKIIVTNLLYNAIKYSEEDGKIKVEMSSDKTHIYFSVQDNGIGIPANEQHLIFNRFFRAKNVVFYPGTGIGLNIVKGYVDTLKGKISFESEENKGTLFKVQLPKIKPHEKNSIIN